MLLAVYRLLCFVFAHATILDILYNLPSVLPKHFKMLPARAFACDEGPSTFEDIAQLNFPALGQQTQGRLQVAAIRYEYLFAGLVKPLLLSGGLALRVERGVLTGTRVEHLCGEVALLSIT